MRAVIVLLWIPSFAHTCGMTIENHFFIHMFSRHITEMSKSGRTRLPKSFQWLSLLTKQKGFKVLSLDRRLAAPVRSMSLSTNAMCLGTLSCWAFEVP